MLGIQTKWFSYPYKQLLRSPRPPRYNLNSQHDVTLHSDKRPRPRPWKLVFTQVYVCSGSPSPVQPSACKHEGRKTRVLMKLMRCLKEGTDTWPKLPPRCERVKLVRIMRINGMRAFVEMFFTFVQQRYCNRSAHSDTASTTQEQAARKCVLSPLAPPRDVRVRVRVHIRSNAA